MPPAMHGLDTGETQFDARSLASTLRRLEPIGDRRAAPSPGAPSSAGTNRASGQPLTRQKLQALMCTAHDGASALSGHDLGVSGILGPVALGGSPGCAIGGGSISSGGASSLARRPSSIEGSSREMAPPPSPQCALPGRTPPLPPHESTSVHLSAAFDRQHSATAASSTQSVCNSARAHGPPVRTAAERLANPERLNLDRRGLLACPLLEGEERLRLINYQNNSIRVIQHLERLPQLIFLDLYNNALLRISGLEAVPTLRVLMLGKNEIAAIEGLGPLGRLDVLDLHRNRIERFCGLGHLSMLRVLNLAGNRISRVDASDLAGLSSLVELNLRRNALTTVCDLSEVPGLQRLFLSSNAIADLASVEKLRSARHLAELALDGNGIASLPNYRPAIAELCPSLRHLDLRRLADPERATASNAGLAAETQSAAASGVQSGALQSGHPDANEERQTGIRTGSNDGLDVKRPAAVVSNGTSGGGSESLGIDAAGDGGGCGVWGDIWSGGDICRDDSSGGAAGEGEFGGDGAMESPRLDFRGADDNRQQQDIRNVSIAAARHAWRCRGVEQGEQHGQQHHYLVERRACSTMAATTPGDSTTEAKEGGATGRTELRVIGTPPDCSRLRPGSAAQTGSTAASEKTTRASFEYVSISWVLSQALPLLAQSCEQLEALHLSHNDLRTPTELLAFGLPHLAPPSQPRRRTVRCITAACDLTARLGALPRLSVVEVAADDNPLVGHPHFRSLAIAALPGLRELNGTPVSDGERAGAEALWRRLRRMMSLATTTVHAHSAPRTHRLAAGDTGPLSAALPTTTVAEGAETKSAPAVPARPPLWMRATAARNAAAAAGSGDGTALAGAQPLRPPPPLPPPLLPEQLDRAGHHGSAEDDEVSPGSSHVKEKPDPVGPFLSRVVNHAVAVHDRIARLNALWPELVQRYDKQVETELRCREALLRHYEAVVYGK